MGWDISEKGFRIVLSRDVPDVVLRNLGRDADEFLAEHGLDRSDVGTWVIHTGGPKVLEATEAALELPEWSSQCFLGVPATDWQSFLGVCSVRFRRNHEESPAGTGHLGRFGGDGSRFLFRAGAAQMVMPRFRTWSQ